MFMIIFSATDLLILDSLILHFIYFESC